MAVMLRPASTLVFALGLMEMAYAMRWSGPQVTPAGLMAMNGVTPRPTQAPGWDGLPRELRKRAAGEYIYPPPPNWCGFVSGDYDTLLSCSTDYTCAFSQRVFGCCTGPAEECGIFTACVDQIFCDENCPADTKVLKCTEKSLAWCGTYSIWGGTLAYICGSDIRSVSVELVEDFYRSLGSSTLTNRFGSPSKTVENQPSDDSTTNHGRSTTSAGPLFPKSTGSGPIGFVTSVSSHPILSGAAIGGIAVGGAIVLIAVAAGIIFACCYRQRRQRRHREDHQNAAAQALMPRPLATVDFAQAPQQGMGQPEKTYGASAPPPYLNPPQSPYTDHAAGGAPSPIQPYSPSQEFTHRASTVSTAVSPHPLHYEDPAPAPSPETVSGYFSPPPPPGGYSELSQGDGIPMQLRAGSPLNQIHSSVHEVPAMTPRAEGERWELPNRS